MWSESVSRNNSKTQRPSRKTRDRGLTLPELLIVVSIMGLLTGVLASALIVTLRQADNTEGRTNVALSATSIDTWLPADLASTDVNKTGLRINNIPLRPVDDRPDAEPCTTTCNGIDLSGTNALQLAWETTIPGGSGGLPQTILTQVQYQYIEDNGDWQLRRIECIGGSPCTSIVVLRGLQPPADPSTFDPDNDQPVWVLEVSVPDNPDSLELADNARKIVVTINGGGDSDGAGGGANSISLTAGGRLTEVIDADEFTVPSFVRASSRCGGPVTLIVDDSGSIGSALGPVVRPGVIAFIEAFRGTPTQVQLVAFQSRARVLGPNDSETSQNGGWHRYIDMTDDDRVDALIDSVQNGTDRLRASGGTNWEDAFFRAFHEADGSNADIQPSRVVFFTDGEATLNRTSSNGAWSTTYRTGDRIDFNDGLYDRSLWPSETGNRFHQESWDRADIILDGHRTSDLIFVGVGPNLNNQIDWIHNPAVYGDRTAPPAQADQRLAWQAISHLLANGPSGHVTAQLGTDDAGNPAYTNPEVADFYLQDSFDADAFGAAMRAAALKDCGGTLTIQTRDADTGDPVDDEFRFENPTYRNDAGTMIEAQARTVTTSVSFRTGTFDFDLSDSSRYFDVDVFPAQFQTNENYDFIEWSCRSGAESRTPSPRPIDGSTFEGFTVRVATNEAVSCTMTVRPK